MTGSKKMFNRDGSTLGVMDDLQVALQSYDGCSLSCAGCLVDKGTKKGRQMLLTDSELDLVQSNVKDYYGWVRANLNTKNDGYFNQTSEGFQVEHFSYTFRFGNHSDLSVDTLINLSTRCDAAIKTFSTALTGDIPKFIEVKQAVPGDYHLEVIFDPVMYEAKTLTPTLEQMHEHGIRGYPEILITKRLVTQYTPKRFADEVLSHFGHMDTQVQFGRYTPSKTRNFSITQLVPLDVEVEWLTGVAKEIVSRKMSIHPIPLAEYAVTFLDEYKESEIYLGDGIGIDESRVYEVGVEEFNIDNIKNKVRDILMTSIYIDHRLDVFIWSESMGQHVLDYNFGFESLGSLKTQTLTEIMVGNPKIESLLKWLIKDSMSNAKCMDCKYKSFCASHAVPLFRKFQKDNGKHCYGYLPVIREYQKDSAFLDNMVKGFIGL